MSNVILAIINSAKKAQRVLTNEQKIPTQH